MNIPKLLALDLDGTLLCHVHSTLSAAHLRLVEAVQQRGIEIAIVTGRSLLTSAPIWHQLRLQTPLICFNGAWVGYPDYRCIQQNRLSMQDVRDIVSVLKKYPGSLSAYPDMHTWKMNQVCATTENWAEIYGTTIQIDPQAFENWNAESLKILYGVDASMTDLIIHDLRQHFQQRFHIVKSQSDRFEILQHVNKKTGLAALAEHLDLKPEEIWAVGDAGNDYEMMHWSGKTFAMGHAPDHVLNAADHILPSIEARGLAALLPYIEKAQANA